MTRSYHTLCREALKRHKGLDDKSGQREEFKLLTLYEVIFDEQMIAVPRTKEEIEPAKELADETTPKDRHSLMPSVQDVKGLFEQLTEGILSRCPESLKDAALIQDLSRTEDVEYPEIIEMAAEGDLVALEDMAADHDVDTDSFLIVVRESLRPLVFCSALERLRADWHETDAGLGEPECPVCGSEPSLVEEVRDRRTCRNLVCSFCGTLWPTQRPLCLFCDIQNPSRYTSIESGSSTGVRADVCDACKMYVKVLPRYESEKGNAISLYIDDLLTRHVDLMAEQEGYEGTAKETFSLF